MGILNKIIGNNRSDAQNLFDINVRNCDSMLERHQMTVGAVLEVVIFGTVHILRKYRQKKFTKYDSFKSEYFQLLKSFCDREGILQRLPGGFDLFVNSRLNLYGEQMELMSQGFPPFKMAYNFFVSPCILNSGEDENLENLMTIRLKMDNYLKNLDLGLRLAFL